jgi:uncharacterized Zn finger protein (UPF0148 family)
VSKYDYPGERLPWRQCERCGGPVFRDTDDSVWCPKCTKRDAERYIRDLRKRKEKE